MRSPAMTHQDPADVQPPGPEQAPAGGSPPRRRGLFARLLDLLVGKRKPPGGQDRSDDPNIYPLY